MLMAYVRYVCEKVNRWCHCGYVKLFNVQTRWEQLRVNQNSWKTGDTIKRCRINMVLWGCGKRWQVLVWIIFSHSIFPTVLLISTHFSEEFLCQWICQHTGTHENAFRNPSFHHRQLLNVYLGYLENLNTFRVHHGWKKGFFLSSITCSCKTSSQAGDVGQTARSKNIQILSLDLKRTLRATICYCQSWSWADLNPCDNVVILLKELFSSGKYTP